MNERQSQEKSKPASIPTEEIDDHIGKLLIPCDRLQAAIRFVWLAAIAGVFIAPVIFAWPDGQLQLVVYLSFLTLVLTSGAIGAAFAYLSLRWLLLAIWPSSTIVGADENVIRIDAGPFGKYEVRWSEVTIQLEGDIDADTYRLLPPEALVPSIRRTHDGFDLFGRMQSLTGLPSETLAAKLKPFVLHAMEQTDAQFRPDR